MYHQRRSGGKGSNVFKTLADQEKSAASDDQPIAPRRTHARQVVGAGKREPSALRRRECQRIFRSALTQALSRHYEVVVESFVARTTRRPPTATVPPSTWSPVVTSAGSDSPVIVLRSMAE